MKARLHVVCGNAPFAELALQLPLVIGRGRRAGLVLPLSLISRQHCEFYEVDDELFLRDLGSTNGTYVNRRRLEQPYHLQSGDLVTVGPVTFRVELGRDQETVRNHLDETCLNEDVTLRDRPVMGSPEGAPPPNSPTSAPPNLHQRPELGSVAASLGAGPSGKNSSPVDPQP